MKIEGDVLTTSRDGFTCLSDLKKAADLIGYTALEINGIIYIKSKTDGEWHETHLTLRRDV
jgi:hypothetical protein